MKGKGQLTVANWRKFQTDFEHALTRVEDATEAEVERKILAELTGKWRVKIDERNLRRIEGQFWVRFTKPVVLKLRS